MYRMLAISLIVLGVAVTSSGIWMLGGQRRVSAQPIEQKSFEVLIPSPIKDDFNQAKEDRAVTLAKLKTGKDSGPIANKKVNKVDKASKEETTSELIDVNSKAGLDFEKFVVKKFNPNYFVIKQWAGDKFVDGRYAESTLEPDLQLELKLNNKRYPIAVECKWRSRAQGNAIRFANEGQLERYQAFEKRTGMPTFIALGLGGTPSSPKDLFIIPVSDVTDPILLIADIYKYKKYSDKDFFFDQEKGELR